MQGKETLRKIRMPLEWGLPCDGMKMRNENQVGVNQNFQPSKNDNSEVKKRMHWERENDGTSKKNQKCTINVPASAPRSGGTVKFLNGR